MRKMMQQLLLIICMKKKQKIYPACVSKNNSNRERQVILSMIPNGGKSKAKSKERWHYLAEKKNCQSY